MSLLVLKLYSKYIELVNIKCYTKYVLKILRKGDFVMNKLLKNSAGIAAIVIVLIVIVGVVAGGATVLAVRMIVTGEDYLAPFEELGWISSDNNEESENDDKQVTGSDEKDEVNIKYFDDTSRLSEKVKTSGVKQYYGSLSMAEEYGYSPSDENYDLYDSLKMELSVFALDGKVIEVVIKIDFMDYVKLAYESDPESYEYETYEEFEEAYIEYFESYAEQMKEVLTNSTDSEYVDIYVGDGRIEMYVTEEGLDSLYEEFDTNPDDSLDEIISAMEDETGIELKEV